MPSTHGPETIKLRVEFRRCQLTSRRVIKLAFHDADTDTVTDTDTDSDSPDTCIHPYVRYARFPRVGVRVGAVECQLKTVADC